MWFSIDSLREFINSTGRGGNVWASTVVVVLVIVVVGVDDDDRGRLILHTALVDVDRFLAAINNLPRPKVRELQMGSPLPVSP